MGRVEEAEALKKTSKNDRFVCIHLLILDIYLFIYLYFIYVFI